ncbi:zinc-binding alcohol dehydrogenase family protein [Accumulibacter sp.]|uniref:zinc-binding alcohol dehydrogenase family protein n=1 Tax=Accumulibacter sp. TaxID=2053492 RepID=UPI0025E4EE48|nr:zinc-binding alcohol dehydrogenase family protein [Accumulibacter sp.]MCP5229930.1 zinc-binding dehydrogenase [Accumulibacter sp.]
MKAWVIHTAGGPERFQLEDMESPKPRTGWALIRVRAFGLNRSEWFTRIGDSPTVSFPRVLGIECVGEIVDPGGMDLAPGTTVAAIMGGMGRAFDGSYAEFTLVPHACVFPVETQLPWEKFAALPEMLQTTHGSLYVGLEIDRAESLLIRGGTSSVGMAALALAKHAGLHVGSTTRDPGKIDDLMTAGADEVWLDDEEVHRQIRDRREKPYDRVLELIGTKTLLDSLRCVGRGGIVCMTGILGGEWALADFHPMGDIPTAVKLTSYSGEAADLPPRQLQEYVSAVESGELRVMTGPVFDFEDLIEAHRLMDANRAGGKIVVRGKQ